MNNYLRIFLLFETIIIIVSEYNGNYKEGKPKKVCYFTNWPIYRKDGDHFTVDDIDYKLCNFIIYSFVALESNYTIKLTDKISDLSDDGGYGQIKNLVQRCNENGVIPMVAIGGWGESNNNAYSMLFTNENLHEAFIENTVHFCKTYGFKGWDWDYEYPQCPQGVCKNGTDERDGFACLIKKMGPVYKDNGFFLSAAVSANKDKIDTYYQPSIMNEYLDWIAVMSYDYHVQSEKRIGLTAPFAEVKLSIEAWIDKKVSPSKILLGEPLYGVSYKLEDKSKYTIGSPAAGVGFKERALYYREICDLIKNLNWTVVTSEDDKSIGGTYIYHEDQWVGFNDIHDVKIKAEYIKEKHLAGYMVWSLDQEDFKDTCGKGKYPLLSTLSNNF